MNILACVLVLHTWSNFTSELTTFADREFHSVSSLSLPLTVDLSLTMCDMVVGIGI